MTKVQRRATWLALSVLGCVLAAYSLRWVIGGRAIEIVDPIVRAWAHGEVEELSDGAYRLTATPIKVNVAEQRLTIDTITLETDAVRNAARETPLPAISAHYFNCSLVGIDLERLARRRGLAVASAGCDSVRMQIVVPAGVARDTSGTAFLALQEDVDLARGVPFVDIDSVVFPHVEMQLRIESNNGHATAVAFNRLAVRFEKLHYDPDDDPEDRRTLLSQNVTLAVDSLHTRREGTDQTDLDRLRLDLADGTVLLRGLHWRPVGGLLTDSLGLVELSLDSLDVAGINWRDFLTRGDVAIRMVHLSGGRITLNERRPETSSESDSAWYGPTWTLGGSLRALDRNLRLDTLIAESVALHHVRAGDTTVSEVGRLTVGNLSASPRSGLDGPEPIGPMTLDLEDVRRRSLDRELRVSAVHLDLGQGTASVDSLRFAPVGTDADFVRRHRRRTDRIDVGFDALSLSGLDAGAWVRLGAYQADYLALTGLTLDVLSDKRMPAGRRGRHLTPQQWMQRVAPPVAIDSLELSGRVQYRERNPDAPAPGVLRFEKVHARIVNLRNIRDPGNDKPTQVRVSSMLMGASPLTVTVEIPLLADAFNMHYAGQLESMAASALNPFLDRAVGARFTAGRVHRIGFEATVTDGMARGRVTPRYEGLWIEVPGVARSGFLSGLRRAVAKFAANQFIIREDNVGGGDDPPRNGPIIHRWRPSETLIQFMWNGVRDGLLQVVKR